MDKYEEALAKARTEYEKARNQGYTWLMDLLEGMFPEVKESEDERIRRHLIDIVETYWGTTNDPGKAADLAWLEKQKELPTNDEMLRTLRTEYEKGVADTIAKYERKEQKFTEKQDYSDLTDLERAIHRGFLVVGVENVPVTIIRETAQDCLAQMKPAEWSEKDNIMLGNIILCLKEYCLTDEINWLKSLRPQQKQEWSNEDEDFINMLILHFNYLINKGGDSVETYKSYIKGLKSLRPPQYCENCKLKRSVENWKPSEEQMEVFVDSIYFLEQKGFKDPNGMIESLYQDLKKL